jgi:hypothetical protein
MKFLKILYNHGVYSNPRCVKVLMILDEQKRRLTRLTKKKRFMVKCSSGKLRPGGEDENTVAPVLVKSGSSGWTSGT